MRGLKDRTVLVTGAANGIGAATARRLAEEGCAIGILDVDTAAGEDVAGEIAARGGRANFYPVDITDYGGGVPRGGELRGHLRAGLISRQQCRLGPCLQFPRYGA